MGLLLWGPASSSPRRWVGPRARGPCSGGISREGAGSLSAGCGTGDKDGQMDENSVFPGTSPVQLPPKIVQGSWAQAGSPLQTPP